MKIWQSIIYVFAIVLFLQSCKDVGENEIEWILVEGASFELGANQIIISPGGDTITGFTSPNRRVELNDFYISKYEITTEQFKKYSKDNGLQMPAAPKYSAHGLEVNYQWEDKKPMLATWYEADAFAKWAGGRLLTEAEWEFAAKGGIKSQGYRYSGSDDPAEVGWVAENSDSTFHTVGQLKANELGLYDMTGNVSEWVSDWYNPELDSLVSNNNPTGPPEGEHKIVFKFYREQ